MHRNVTADGNLAKTPTVTADKTIHRERTDMAAIAARELAYRIGDKTILENVSFSLEEGARLGVVGINGSGKSTLLRILSGELEPDGGELFIPKNSSVGILHQDDTFNVSSAGDTVIEQMYAAFPELLEDEAETAHLEENLTRERNPERLTALSARLSEVNAHYVEHGGMYFRSRCRSMLTSLGFDESYHNLKISDMSGGQRTRIALARELAREPDVLLLDEPTNHLDTATLEWLEAHLSTYPKTLITVSHDRYFLDRVTTATLDIENHRSEFYGESYTGYVAERRRRREIAEHHFENQQREIARQEAYIENQRRWGRERNIRAAESREKALARMERIERPAAEARRIRFTIDSSGESGEDVLTVRNLAVRYPGRELFSGISFLLRRGDRLFIKGPNGCGKSTLIRVLMGQLPPSEGKIDYGYNVKIGYYSQDNQNLTPSNTVKDELWNAHPGLGETDIRNTLAFFMFRGDDAEKPVSALSGGERARLTIAKLILSKMNLLILDEPTNHLDIGSREALEEALKAFDGTLIAVSHDRYFVRQLETRELDLTDAHTAAGTANGKHRENQISQSGVKNGGESAEIPAKSGNKEEYLKRREAAAELRRAKRRLEAAQREEEKLESHLVEIEDELFGPAATDYIRAAELHDEKTVTEDRLMQLYAEEEELTAFIGAVNSNE